uniref:Major facilitator superfamily protein n=1 Tax=Phyllotreta armoraciae TaxID=1553667 RepID=A0A858Z6S0_9CUCU|nr:major facilitator superfamily protein [Phyllotreta armoraciae]
MVEMGKAKELEVDQHGIKYIPDEKGAFVPEKSKQKPDSFFLSFSMLSVNLIAITGASTYSWTSPVIPKLLSNDTDVNPLDSPATTMEISMLAGLPNLTCTLGIIIAPIIANILGRKKANQIFSLAMLFCNTMVAFSSKMVFITIFRSVIMAGFMGSVASMLLYVAESCETHNRAKYSSFTSLAFPIGDMLSFAIGPHFSVRTFTLLLNIPLILYLISSIFVSESPVFLLSNGLRDKAFKVLLTLRSNKTRKEVEEEFIEMENNLKQNQSSKNAGYLSLVKTKEGRKGVALGIIPMLAQYMSGAAVIIAFLGPIFDSPGAVLSGDSVALIVGILRIIATYGTISIIEKFNRKTLLMFSSLGCGFCMSVLGILFFLNSHKTISLTTFQLLSIIFIISFIVIFCLGLAPVPPVMVSEFFPTDLRSVGTSAILTLVSVALYIESAGFPFLNEYAGTYWCLWVFSLNMLVSSIAIYCFVPETRGKSFSQIQEEIGN